MDTQRCNQNKFSAIPVVLSLLLFIYAAMPAYGEAGPELIANGGFEEGATGWTIFVPDESEEKHCEFTVVHDQPHSGNSCAELNSGDFARFCIAAKRVDVEPGGHYRVSVWYRAGQDAQFSKKPVGMSIRLTLGSVRLQIGAEGVVVPGNPPAMKNPVPTEWTQDAAVIEIPPAVTTLSAELFSTAKGAMFFDDLSVKRVDASAALTPLSNGAAYSSLTSVAPNAPPPPQAMPAVPGPVTSDAQIIGELNLDLPGMEKVKAVVQGGNLAEVESAYLEYRRHGSKVRWRTIPSDKPATAVEADDKVGDEVAAHNVIRDGYHYGPAVCFMGKDFNWLYNPVPKGDPSYSDEFTYCVVARTESWQHLADAYWKTGDEKYAKAWVEILKDFALKNPMRTNDPPGASVWRTLDSATRMDVSWPYCYFRFLDSPSFTPDAQWVYLKMMRDHALRLAQGLEDKSRTGNWVTDECDALYTIGALFPELKDASSWRDIGIDRLTVECNRTMQPDGMESELTPGYHFGALGQFRGPFDLAKLNNLTIPPVFKDKILAMYRAPVIIMQQNGQDVCTNDSWVVNARKSAKSGLEIGDDPVLAWAASGGKSGTPLPDSTCLPYAGFYTMRSGWDWNDMFVFFRGGPPGSGHEHQDKLEVTLRAWDNDLLIDPGTYTYDKSNFRRYFIGTASHDTIIVDGKWQHRPNNVPPVKDPANCPYVNTPLFDYVAGTYDDCYQQSQYVPAEFQPQEWVGDLDKSVSHTRRVLYLRPFYVLVLDTLDGTGNHSFEAHWQIGPVNGNNPAPSAPGQVDSSSQAYFSDRASDVNIALFPLERDHLTVNVVVGQKSPILGWATREDHAFPNPTVCFIKQEDTPATFATLLYPYQKDAPPAVTEKSIEVDANAWAQSIATPHEKAEVVIVKDGTSKQISFRSSLTGTAVTAQAAGLLLRQPTGQSLPFAGGWDVRNYNDGAIAFTSDTGVGIAFTRDRNPLFFNAGSQTAGISLTQPTAVNITLAPQVWTDASGHPAKAPSLFASLIPARKK